MHAAPHRTLLADGADDPTRDEGGPFPPQWRECRDCGLLQCIPALPTGAVARCPRCHHVLRRHRTDPFLWPLAMAASGLMLMLVVVLLPFMDLSVLGQERETTLTSGPLALEQGGYLPLAALVLFTTFLAPVARLLGLAWVVLALRLRHPPRHLAVVFRWVEVLRPWSMVEVFLLGVFVAYTKLVDLARVDVGAACYAMGALMLTMAAADATLDPAAVWARLPPRGEARPASRRPPGARPVGCPHCALVSVGEPTCPRCGGDLPRRKPDSLTRTWALLAAAICLYVPANVLPILTLVRLGKGAPSTIIGGALELLAAGMWPLALLVFFASITVPVLKVAGLVLLLVTTQRGSAWRLGTRTRLYRVIEFIGRWSMIDVFMISILTAVVHLGFVANVTPEPGVLAFAAVVIITMFAAITFDPRLMWDAAGRNPAVAPARRAELPGALARPA